MIVQTQLLFIMANVIEPLENTEGRKRKSIFLRSDALKERSKERKAKTQNASFVKGHFSKSCPK